MFVLYESHVQCVLSSQFILVSLDDALDDDMDGSDPWLTVIVSPTLGNTTGSPSLNILKVPTSECSGRLSDLSKNDSKVFISEAYHCGSQREAIPAAP